MDEPTFCMSWVGVVQASTARLSGPRVSRAVEIHSLKEKTRPGSKNLVSSCWPLPSEAGANPESWDGSQGPRRAALGSSVPCPVLTRTETAARGTRHLAEQTSEGRKKMTFFQASSLGYVVVAALI